MRRLLPERWLPQGAFDTPPPGEPGAASALVGRWQVVAGMLVAGVLGGCGGEVDVERLAVRPSIDQWQNTIQPLFREMGCSVPGACHGDDFRGEVRVMPEPDAGQSYTDYLSVKGALNLSDPERSPLLVRLLRGGPGGNHFPPCFNSRDSCAWRKVVAWISDDGTGPGPDDIDCDASEEFCRP